MQIQQLNIEHKNSWEILVQNNFESGFMQSWNWADFKEAESQNTIKLGIFNNDNLIAGGIIYYLPTTVSSTPLFMPHGPVLPWNNLELSCQCYNLLINEINLISSKFGSPIFRIEPILNNKPHYLTDFIRSPLDLIPSNTLIIDLDQDEQTMLTSMKHKGRYNINKSIKHKIEYSFSNSINDIDSFYNLFEITYNRHGFFGEPISFFKNLIQYLGSNDMARIYFAKYRDIIVSSAIVIFYGSKATYLYGGSLPFFSHLQASYGLHWKIINDARNLGLKFYDFYGIMPENVENHRYKKFTQFKTRFGGKKINYMGAHDYYFYPQMANLVANNINLFK